MQAAAYEAYANRDFSSALSSLGSIVQVDPGNPRWREMRAQVRCMAGARAGTR